MGHRGTFYVTSLHPDGSGDCSPGDTWRVDYTAGVARRLRDGREEPASLGAIGAAALRGDCLVSRRPPLMLAPPSRRRGVA